VLSHRTTLFVVKKKKKKKKHTQVFSFLPQYRRLKSIEHYICRLCFTDEHSKIDHEVNKVKSIWQTLQNEKNWMKGTGQIGNARMKKLYEILEKVTCEIDKVQKIYVESRTNHLHRSETDTLKTDNRRTRNLEKEIEIVRNRIFPKKRARINSEIRFRNLKNIGIDTIGKDATKIRFNEMERVMMDKRSIQNLFPSNDTSALSEHETNERNIDDCVAPGDIIAASIPNKDRDTIMNITSTFRDNNKLKPEIKSIEKYMQNSENILHDITKKETQEQDMKSSAKDIADILTGLNIESVELYENFEQFDDNYDMKNRISKENENCLSIVNGSARVTRSIETIQEEGKAYGDTKSLRNMKSQASDTQPTKLVKSTDTSRSNARDNAFIKMGLDVLNRSLSKDKRKQILHSEYLKKDLCF